jgi:hypothetical protein
MNRFYILLTLSYIVISACNPLEEIYDELDHAEKKYRNEITYVLTSDDYNTIAGLALRSNPDDTMNADIIAESKCFNNQVSASVYLPSFIAYKYPVLGESSVADIGYNYCSEYPEYLSGFVSPEIYYITDENYASVGVQQGTYKTFIGIDNAAGYISVFLKDSIESPSEKQIRLVFYRYATQINDPSETAALTGNDLKILVDHVRLDINPAYLNTWGDGEFYYGADAYFGNFDLRLSQRINHNVEGFEELSAEESEALIQERLQEGIIYILQHKYPGAVPIVGSDTVYYNISYSTFEVTVHQYYAVYKCTSTGPPPDFRLFAGPTEDYLNLSITVKTEKGEYFQFNGADWAPVEGVYYLNSSDYDEMGEPGVNDYFSDIIQPGNYLPRFLTLKYPYAQPGNKIAIAYKFNTQGSTLVLAEEYRFNDSWSAFNPLSIQYSRFIHDGEKWILSAPEQP